MERVEVYFWGGAGGALLSESLLLHFYPDYPVLLLAAAGFILVLAAFCKLG